MPKQKAKEKKAVNTSCSIPGDVLTEFRELLNGENMSACITWLIRCWCAQEKQRRGQLQPAPTVMIPPTAMIPPTVFQSPVQFPVGAPSAPLTFQPVPASPPAIPPVIPPTPQPTQLTPVTTFEHGGCGCTGVILETEFKYQTPNALLKATIPTRRCQTTGQQLPDDRAETLDRFHYWCADYMLRHDMICNSLFVLLCRVTDQTWPPHLPAWQHDNARVIADEKTEELQRELKRLKALLMIRAQPDYLEIQQDLPSAKNVLSLE